MIGGMLATAGGLVFTGEGNGQFKAYDAETGAILWKFQAGAGVNAPPSSYTVDGKQYIVVGGRRQRAARLQARQQHHRLHARLSVDRAELRQLSGSCEDGTGSVPSSLR